MFWYLLGAVIAVLVFDAVLAFLIWILVAGVWNSVIRGELQVRRNFVWACLLCIAIAIANAVVIAHLQEPGNMMILSVVFILVLDEGLLSTTWFLTDSVWNNMVREKLRVTSNTTWAYLYTSVIVIANAVAIGYLWLQ